MTYRDRPRNSNRYEREYNDKPFLSAEQEHLDKTVALFSTLSITNIHTKLETLTAEYRNDQKVYLDAFKIVLPQMPLKLHLFALLIASLNSMQYETAKDFINVAFKSLQESLDKCEFRKVKLITRFVADLAGLGVFESEELVKLLDLYLGVGKEDMVKQERLDQYLFIVLATLPWAFRVVVDENRDRIYATLQDYINQRSLKFESTGISLAHRALSAYKLTTFGTEDSAMDGQDNLPYPIQDRLDLLWSQIENLKEAGWQVPLLMSFPSEILVSLEGQIKHKLPVISIPSSVTVVKFTYQPKFWVFDDSVNVEGQAPKTTLPRTGTIGRFILEDILTDTIRIFSLNHKECATMLLESRYSFNIEYLEENKIQIFESVIESIFCELFRLPKTSEKPVYYTTLVMDLCRESLDKIPSVLGRSIKILYSRLACMDVELINRFSELFSHHLSNFGFSWRWSDWEDVLKMDKHTAQFVFVRESLDRCVRLAYFERIRTSIPPNFEEHAELFPAMAPTFTYVYQDSELIQHDLSDLIRDLDSTILRREESTVVEELMDKIESLISSNPNALARLPKSHSIEQSPANVAHEVLMQCVMYQGSKSFSHLLNVIERLLPLLQKKNQSENQRQLTCEITFNFWSKNKQFLEIILGKLDNYRILDPKSILKFLISEQLLAQDFDKFYVWSVLRSTFMKLQLKQDQVVQKMNAKKFESSYEQEMTDDPVESLEVLEQALENAKTEQQQAFLYCFELFVKLLSARLEADSNASKTPFWYWVSGNMLETARFFQKDIQNLKYTLDSLVFGNEVHPDILELWNGIKIVLELNAEDS